MNTANYILTLLLLAMPFCACFYLQPLSLSPQRVHAATSQELVNIISKHQPQVTQKLIKHYLIQQIAEWEYLYLSESALKQKIYQLFNDYNRGEVAEKVATFMKRKLFIKLDMNNLTESFKTEINSNPEEYFLTPDMYDLLID